MNIAAFKVFGANPIPMPFAEVYTGLETRTIDAQEGGIIGAIMPPEAISPAARLTG